MGMSRKAEKAQPMTCLSKVLKIKIWKLVHIQGFIKRNLEWLEGSKDQEFYQGKHRHFIMTKKSIHQVDSVIQSEFESDGSVPQPLSQT